MKPYIVLVIASLFLVALGTTGCAGKRDRIYVGQCGLPGHWFCGKRFDSFAECNNARKRHDYETSLPGTCYSGDPRGRPDTRTM